VCSEPAIYLQEAITNFAANFIRWATVWTEQNAEQSENKLSIGRIGIKRQVQGTVHISARVIQNSEGMWLRFGPASSLAGTQLFFKLLANYLARPLLAAFYAFDTDCAKVTLVTEIQQRIRWTTTSVILTK